MDEILQGFRRAGRVAFRTREYAALLGKPNYARLVLHRLKAKGGLILVKRGWWAFPDALPEAIACDMSQPAYVSFHSALFLRNLTTQMPRIVQLAVARNAKTYLVGKICVKEYRVGRTQFTGFYRMDGVLVASSEKAVADCLAHPRACPEIIIKEAIGSVDAGKVTKMLVSAAAKRRFARLMKDARQG